MGVPLSVKEWMRGYVGFGATDYAIGSRQGLEDETRFEHAVTISIADIDQFVASSDHPATMTGHIQCSRFGRCDIVDGGLFNMLVDAAEPDVKYMFYKLPFDAGGKRHTMIGHKTLRDDPGFDLWGDITTLEVSIYDFAIDGTPKSTPAMGKAIEGKVPIAMGVLHIELADGMRSALSFKSEGSALEKAVAIKKFCGFYGSRLWDLFAKARFAETQKTWTATEAFEANQALAPVKWFLAGDLLRSAAKIARSTLGNELDIRDWMTHDEPIDLRRWPTIDPRAAPGTPEATEMWFDYIADTGDDPKVMENLAGLIGKPVTIDGHNLPIGPFVFVGGDTAYHVADETTLRIRFVEPFRRALGITKDVRTIDIKDERHLFGIPGNHDYYDNLVGFNRMFRRPFRQREGVLQIPGYELRQEASYVKLLLPGGWQLWGVDLANGLDYRQWRYFNKVPDKLILCVATPPVTFDEVRVPEDKDDTENKAYRRLFDIPKTTDKLELDPTKIPLRKGQALLHIAGDDHHYARYDNGEAESSAIAIVSGGGGAFLHPTETSRGDVRRSATYPSEEVSALQSTKVLNPAVMFSAGLVYVVGAILAAIMYWTFPRDWSWPAMRGSWGWFGAVAVSSLAVFGAYKANKRITAARTRIAKDKRPTTAGNPKSDPALSEIRKGDLLWANKVVRPIIWIGAITIALASPFVSKQIVPDVAPLAATSAFLVVAAALIIGLARFASSRGWNVVFGALHAIVQLGLPMSLVLTGTVWGYLYVGAAWVLFMALAGKIYVACHRDRGKARARRPWLAWPLAGLWLLQGPIAIAVLWAIPLLGIAPRLVEDPWWGTLAAAAVGLVVVTFQFGWYLLVGAAFGAHNNELGSAIRTTKYKQWIRFHVTRDVVTGYVLGVDDPLHAAIPKLVDTFKLVPSAATQSRSAQTGS